MIYLMPMHLCKHAWSIFYGCVHVCVKNHLFGTSQIEDEICQELQV